MILLISLMALHKISSVSLEGTLQWPERQGHCNILNENKVASGQCSASGKEID